MEAIIGFIGVIVGVLLNEFAQWLRSRRAKNEQKKAVRTLLRLEIDRNLELLQNFWNQVDQGEGDQAELPVEERRVQLAFRFIELPLPDWHYEAQESQMSLLPEALSEQEIIEIYKLRGQFDKITTINEKLSNIQSERRDHSGPKMKIGIEKHIEHIENKAYDQRISSLWQEAEVVISHTLGKGNPLKNKT